MKIKKSKLKKLIEDYLYEKDEEETESGKEKKEESDSPVDDLARKMEDSKKQPEPLAAAYDAYKRWGSENPDVKHKLPPELLKYFEALGYLKAHNEEEITHNEFIKKHGRELTIKTKSKEIDIQQSKDTAIV